MSKQHRKTLPIKLVLILLIIAIAAFAGYRILAIRQAGRDADQVLDTMYDLIPGLGVETGVSTGVGKDPLLSLSINGIDIVGCLEIPSLDLMTPVSVASEEYEGFLNVVSGSPVKGKLMLEGDKTTTLSGLSKAQPGDTVVFTDVEGIRYHYRVLTQFHLKNWDEADNDLMVCYRVDDQTRFVLGCTRAE